ncbi:NAD(+)/NADH kinase [Methanosphaerula palustris]|uniref:NAD(+)/NADH kinase n=1 Tax=Methanosphaerula palustris TaxID=475088 RepID=UPI0001848431|nr:NAD(+)/NADH kinase [Methanosphaerula palustris]
MQNYRGVQDDPLLPGDGTAREIFVVAGREIPILGIPAGVKMYSALFAIDPATAAEIIDSPTQYTLRDAEVMDVDEEAYRIAQRKQIYQPGVP